MWRFALGLFVGLAAGHYLTQTTFEKQLSYWQIDRTYKTGR